MVLLEDLGADAIAAEGEDGQRVCKMPCNVYSAFFVRQRERACA